MTNKNTWRVIFAVGYLLFCSPAIFATVLICYLVMYGS
jgi:hypothetical protein